MIKRSKRILSFLLAAAVTVSAMPSGSFAVYDPDTGLCEHHTAHTEDCGYSAENGTPCAFVCDICRSGADLHSDDGVSGAVARVTLNDGSTTDVTDLSQVFIKENVDSVAALEVKLLRDVTVSEEIEVKGNNWKFTLDLAGHTISGSGTVLNISYKVNFTIRDSIGSGAINGEVATNEWSADLTLEGGTYKRVSINQANMLKVTGENVVINDLYINNRDRINAQLSAGSYGRIDHGYGCKRLLSKGSEGNVKYYAFHNAEGKPLPVYDSTQELENVTVKECKHNNNDAMKYERVDDDYHKKICLACGCVLVQEAHTSNGNGGCTVCSVVSVTVKGTTTYLSNFADAFKSEYDGGEIKLLCNVIVNSEITVSSGTFTFDLAGHTVNFSGGYNNRLNVGGNAEITVCDSVGKGRMENGSGGPAIYMNYVNNNAVLTLEGGSFSLLYIECGSLTVDSSNVHVEELIIICQYLPGGSLKVQLSAGNYDKIRMINSDYFIENNLGKILKNYGQTAEPHYAFYLNGSPVSAVVDDGGTGDAELNNVTVEECNHSINVKEYKWKNESQHTVTCSACGYSYDEAHTGTDGQCSCIAAKVELPDGSVKYVSSLQDAFTKENSGAVITMLKDFGGGQIELVDQYDESFTLDLNGHKIFNGAEYPWGSLMLMHGSVIIDDSAGGGAVEGLYIQNVILTVNGGQFINDGGLAALYLGVCTAEINGGYFSSGIAGIVSDGNGYSDVTINGGTFTATGDLSPAYSDVGEISIPVSGLYVIGEGVKLKGGEFSGKDYAVCISSDESGTVPKLSELLGHTDTERYAYYNGADTVTSGLDGTSLTGTITVKKCNHKGAIITDNNNGTHTYANCPACGGSVDRTEDCDYGDTYTTDENNTSHIQTCTVCGHEIVEAHKTAAPENAATCEKKAVCDICKKEYGDFAAHTLTKTEAVDPTCTETGNSEYWTCSVCGKMFSDEDGTAEIDKIPTTPALGHDEVEIPAVDATCTTAGHTAGSECSRCGKILTAPETVPATGHKYGTEWKSDAANHWYECTACGDRISVTAHTPDSGTVTVRPTTETTGTRVIACTECKAFIREETIPVIDPEHEHEYGTDWKFNSDQHWHECICGDTIEMSAHIWDGGIPVTAPTCTEEGVVRYTCTVCGITKTEPVNALGHSFTNYIFNNDATCTADGTETAVCDRCHTETSTRTAAGSKKAHTEDGGTITKQPTETETGIRTFYCTVCGSEVRTETIPAFVPEHTHVFGTTWNYDSASHWHECTCGEKSDTASHISDGGTVTKQPTQTETGTKEYKCTVCGYVMKTETIPAIPEGHIHSYSTIWSFDSANHWHECSCGDKTDTAAHTSDGGTVTKQPTQTETGTKEYKCTVCGYVMKTETIPAAGRPSVPVDPPYDPPAPSVPSSPSTPAAPSDPVTAPSTGKEPFIQSDNGKTGWDAIYDIILNTPDGGSVTVNMNGTTILPEKIVSLIRGRDIDLVLIMNNKFVWTVNGMNVTNARTVNMGIQKATGISSSTVEEYFDDMETVQIRLAHNGDFGFTAELSISLGSIYNGMTASSYCYKAGKFSFGDSTEIADGSAKLKFSHASNWLIAITDAAAEDVSADAAISAKGDPVGSEGSASLLFLTVIPILGAAFACIKELRRK